RDATDLHAITHDMDRVASGNTAARSAVEIALFDLLGKAHGVPLHQLFGGRVRETVPTIWHLSGGDAKATAEDAVRAQKEGFELFKVKVGTGTLDEDVARVCAVREAVGPEGSLLLDANQGWTVEEAVLFCRQVEPQRPGHELVRGVAGGAPHQRPEPRQHLLDVEGFCDVVVGAG
ncbi:MAG: hypothetical protein GEV00_24160, partial [Actinophytocola sp.]|nr:hypothetical protein [Actinophytocola sp.]